MLWILVDCGNTVINKMQSSNSRSLQAHKGLRKVNRNARCYAILAQTPRTVTQYKNIAERYVTGKMWAHQEPLNNSP